MDRNRRRDFIRIDKRLDLPRRAGPHKTSRDVVQAVENEVDRYISWPGQALAYKLGQREILRLRDRANEVLGPDFEIKTFHDRVLENGAVSLAVLATIIEEWLAEEAAGS